MNISELLEREAAGLEAEFTGLTADAGTPRAIRRRRAVRQGATAGVAVFGVGALALGGLRLGGSDAPEPGSNGVVGQSPDIVRAALIDPEGDPKFTPYAYVPACGEPAPTMRTEAEGLQLLIHSTEDRRLDILERDWHHRIGAYVVNNRAEALNASVSEMALVWVRGGKVIAYSESPVSAIGLGRSSMGFFAAGATRDVHGELGAPTFLCDTPVDGPWETVGVGDYTVYGLTRVVGSYTDSVAGKLERLDVPLVSAPFTVRVDSTWEQYRTSLDGTAPLPADLSCGSVVTPEQYATGSSAVVWKWPDTTGTTEQGGLVTYMFDFLDSRTTVDFPEQLHIWLIARGDEDWTIVGSMSVTGPSPWEITLTRWGEVRSVPVTLEQIEFCGEVPPVLAAFGTADLTITDHAGTRTVTVPVR